MRLNLYAVSAVFYVLCFVSVSVSAEDKSTTISLGAAVTQGNSETLQANASLISECKNDAGSVKYGVEANYGESTVDEVTDTTVDNTKLFGNVKRSISKSTFGYVDASVFRDDIALIDYRAVLGLGVGYYFVKSEDTELSLQIGVAYVWEDVDSLSEEYTALRAAQTFKHKLSDTAKIWESVEYLPQADDGDNYLLNAELGVEAALNSHMNLRLVAQDKYDNVPAAELERNDISLIAGISVKL